MLSKLCESVHALHLSAGSEGSLEGVRLPDSGFASLTLSSATERISQLVGLLEDLSTHVDNDGQQKIDELLVSVCVSRSERRLF